MKIPLLCALLFVLPAAHSAPNEIKIFTDELADYGEHTLETHVNKASRAASKAKNRSTPVQFMPEYSYGLWRNWEVSLQLPFAVEHDRIRTNGCRGELQYVAPHDEDTGAYWGFNIEVGNIARIGDERIWGAELVPILGWRMDRWHLVANPAVRQDLAGSRRKVNFEPAFKAAYKVECKNYIGLEYYVDAGPLRRLLANNERSRVLYLTWDGKVGKSDINLGIGRGFTSASDEWVAKAVFEFAF